MVVLTYLLGYKNVKNYDGSWTEWGNLIEAPIEQMAMCSRRPQNRGGRPLICGNPSLVPFPGGGARIFTASHDETLPRTSSRLSGAGPLWPLLATVQCHPLTDLISPEVKLDLKRRHVLPGFGLSMGFTILYLSLIVLIPLSMLFH